MKPLTAGTALTNRVRRYCAKHGLFRAGIVVVAVSGGADSLVLLHVLRDLCSDFQITLHVATLDHGLRGAEGAADADFVRQVANQLAIPITVGAINVPDLARSKRLGIEEAARQARYQFLTELAHSVGSTQIAVAHQRNDQAETVLMHLLRGSGLAGLRGMLPVTMIGDQVRLIRPLLETPRSIIDVYASVKGIIPRIDSTNADSNYARNRIRMEILPALRTVNPALDTALAQTAEIARADYDALQWSWRAQLPDWPTGAERGAFQALPRALQRLAVRHIGSEWRFEQVEGLIDWLLKATAGDLHPLPEGAALLVTTSEIRFLEASELPFRAIAPGCPLLRHNTINNVLLPGTVDLADGWQLTARYCPQRDQEDDPDWSDPLTTMLSLPPETVISVRTRQPGDRFTPKGMGGHSRKLSDTLIDLKVPIAWRDQLALLVINDQIAWFVAPTANGLKARVAEPFIWQHNASLSSNWRFSFHLQTS